MLWSLETQQKNTLQTENSYESFAPALKLRQICSKIEILQNSSDHKVHSRILTMS